MLASNCAASRPLFGLEVTTPRFLAYVQREKLRFQVIRTVFIRRTAFKRSSAAWAAAVRGSFGCSFTDCPNLCPAGALALRPKLGRSVAPSSEWVPGLEHREPIYCDLAGSSGKTIEVKLIVVDVDRACVRLRWQWHRALKRPSTVICHYAAPQKPSTPNCASHCVM